MIASAERAANAGNGMARERTISAFIGKMPGFTLIASSRGILDDFLRHAMQRQTGEHDAAQVSQVGITPFAWICKARGLLLPLSEYRFAPPRRWRFDFAFVAERLAIEIQGGIFTAGRHVRGAALVREYEKLNAAAILGWRILFVTPKQFSSGEVLAMVEEALKHH